MNEKYLKYGCLLIGLFSLTGCAGPQIKESYNEFKGTKVCRLEPYVIRSELGFSKGRVTSISLEQLSEDNIKAILTARISRGLGHYDSFRDNSKIKFIIKNPGNKVEEFIFVGSDLSFNHQTIPQGLINVHIDEGLLTFTIKAEQLRKIINAPVTEFYFESGKHPITGELSNSDKAALREFLDKCMPLSGGKK